MYIYISTYIHGCIRYINTYVHGAETTVEVEGTFIYIYNCIHTWTYIIYMYVCTWV